MTETEPSSSVGEAAPRLSPSEIALLRAQWQPVLFAKEPSRLRLLEFRPPWRLQKFTVRVHRNHSFEHVAAATAGWFAWWQREAQFIYTEYDDSLSTTLDNSIAADLELIWVDFNRYRSDLPSSELAAWLAGRVESIRTQTDGIVLVIALHDDCTLSHELSVAMRGLPGVRVADPTDIRKLLGSRFYDERAARFSGTRLSNAGCLHLARELACRWAPAALRPRIKAIALDLDHTLYDGVLGEDGIGVKLSADHAALQRFLVSLQEQGLLLALVSRNEEADARQLFEERPDFPLRWEHFSATAVSWQSKSAGILATARRLHIGLESILFLDDNPGELAIVAGDLPEVATAHAMPSPDATIEMLDYWPGLWAWDRSSSDKLRAEDLRAEDQRAEIEASALDPQEYLRCLQVSIKIHVTPRQRLGRLHELSQKTNQFNTNLQRLSEVQLARFLDSPEHRVAAISLSDRLSDSGLIGLIVGERQGKAVVVQELAISCRALGRRLEDAMIGEAVRALASDLGSEHVQLQYRTGPRNSPAREWLAGLVGASLPPAGCVRADQLLVSSAETGLPVAIEIFHDDQE